MTDRPRRPGGFGELCAVFLKLGLIGFGGPAAHVAILEEDVVRRRRWVSSKQFLDLIAATAVIPGPNSTELVALLGYMRAGFLGMLVAGVCFVVPAATMTTGLAIAYARWGEVPEVVPVLAGIKPAVVIVILGAVVRLGRTALARWPEALIAVCVALAALLGAPQVATLLLGGVIGMVMLRWVAAGLGGSAAVLAPLAPFALGPRAAATAGAAVLAAPAAATSAPPTLVGIGLLFLKVGAVLYGSGYVLVAFLEDGLVHGHGWLTQQQLLDAVAVGQLTPGPLLSTAAFVGLLLGGAPGAIVATVAIFLPSFLFVLVLHPLVPRLRQSAWAAAFLDAVTASAVALMVVVMIRLGLAAMISWQAVAIASVAALVHLRYRVGAAWVICGGAVAGWLLI